ncbi:helix-turn-helix domain-containing protein [Marinagarivorans algicola]|uniref:helix-turn-helix domain-containing protein n=1 Tax=Marinagarivorans algicola TaxID=1513270 RepID=UPI0006B8C8CA|nr:helix-turn-helix transcriptional regulator [Marinagarivorans algicola]
MASSIQRWAKPMTPQDKTFYQQLGKRIAEQRKARGLTQTELAEILGISQQTMAHYEGGRLRVALSMMPSLSQALDVMMSDLMEEQITTPSKRGPQSKLQLQIEQVHSLPRAKQKFVSEMLETVIQGR